MAGRAAPSLPVRAPSGTPCRAHQSEHTAAAMFLFTLCNDVLSCPPTIIRVLMSERMSHARGAFDKQESYVAAENQTLSF